MSSIFTNIFAVTIANFATTILNFLYYPVLTKLLGISSEILGRYQYYQSTANVIVIFCILSLNYAFISEKKEHTTTESLMFINTSIMITSIIYVFVIIIVSFSSSFKFFDFLLVVSIGIAEIFFILGNTLLRDKKIFGLIAKILILKSFLNVLIGLGFVIFFRSEISLVVALIFSSIVTGLFSIKKRFGAKYKFLINFQYFKKLLSQNKTVVIFQTAVIGIDNLNKNLPIFGIEYNLGHEAVGLYSLSMKLLGAANALLSRALGQTFLPYFSKSRRDEIMIFKKFSLISAIFFPLLSLVSFLAFFYVPLLFGREFVGAVSLIALMVPEFFMNATISPYTSSIIAHKKNHLSFLLNIVTNILLLSVIQISKLFSFDLWYMTLSFTLVFSVSKFLFMILSFKVARISPWKDLILNSLYILCLFGLALPWEWSYVFLFGNLMSLYILIRNRSTIKNAFYQLLTKFKHK